MTRKTKAEKKLHNGWRPAYQDGKLKIPRKLKKAWRKGVVDYINRTHPGYEHTWRLRWRADIGWEVRLKDKYCG